MKPALKKLLNPGWILTIILVVGFSYTAFTVLSPWQLRKDAQIVERNEHIEQAFATDPQPYEQVFDTAGSIKGNNEWMRVSLTGTYLREKEVELRLRPVASTPALQALTPFQLITGQILLINRGFIPDVAGEEETMPPAPAGEVTLIAHARLNEPVPATAPRTTTPIQVYGINTEQIGELTATGLAVDWAQLAENQPGALTAIPLPQLDRGNHLSYGFQWIAFGIIAPVGLIYLIVSDRREKRRFQQETAQLTEHAAPLELDAEESEAAAQPPAQAAGAPDGLPTLTNDATPDKGVDLPGQPPPPTRTRSRYGDTGHGIRRGRR